MTNTINRLQLYLLLRKNVKLSEKRSTMFEANQYGKLFAYIGMGFMAVYFIAIGTFLGWAAVDTGVTEMIFFLMPLLMILDFGARFMTQQTPTMLVKPYLLTPISKFTAIECFLINQLLDLGNLVWMTLFLPYAFICFCGGMSIWATLALLLMLQLIVTINSQWYMLVRTLVNESMLWWALPAAIYGGMILPLFFLSEKTLDKTLDTVLEFIYDHAFTWPTFVILVTAVAILFIVNRSLQMRLVYSEISKQEKTKLRTVSELKALNRFGLIGEYLKLEVKSTMRNKAIRTRFIQGISIITVLSLIIAFTDTYTGSFARNGWCLYCFVFFGAVNLVKIMGPEGNYIDMLMVHRENILTLLRAKYYFYCAILLLPTLILIPPVISGRFPLLMILAYLFITSGLEYFILFQLAIWNNQTLPLNDKITGKNQMENKLQIIVELIVFIVPVTVVMILQAIFSETVAFVTMIVIGLAFTLTEPLWMRNIYQRMMRRRYTNLEGFHTTR